MANKMLKWVTGSAAAFAALDSKDTNTLYFIQDTGEIYKGDKPFTEAVIFVDGEFPAKGAVGKVYVKESDLEGRVWTGTEWKTIIQPIADTLTDGARETKAVSGEAVKTYVTNKFAEQVGKYVEEISYDKENKQLKVTKNGQQEPVAIEGFVTGVDYDAGVLTFNVQGGDTIKINLPEDNFVESGRYNEDTEEIELTLQNGDIVKIPATSLVDIYTGGTTNSVTVAVSHDNTITANVKVSTTGENALSIKDDGLFVAPIDITGKMDKVDTGRASEILVASVEGGAELSGFKAGNGTISDEANANTLATEAAVAAIKTALQGNIENKFDKANIKTSLTSRNSSEASDEHVLSEKATLIKLEALDAKKLDATKVVTAVNAEAPAEDKVVSEKALVAAISWTVLTEPEESR